MSAEIEQTIRIRNPRSQDLELHLEPWGEQFVLAPGATVDIVARGPAGGCLELESGSERIVVYGWAGSVAAVVSGGRELSSGERVTSP